MSGKRKADDNEDNPRKKLPTGSPSGSEIEDNLMDEYGNEYEDLVRDDDDFPIAPNPIARDLYGSPSHQELIDMEVDMRGGLEEFFNDNPPLLGPQPVPHQPTPPHPYDFDEDMAALVEQYPQHSLYEEASDDGDGLPYAPGDQPIPYLDITDDEDSADEYVDFLADEDTSDEDTSGDSNDDRRHRFGTPPRDDYIAPTRKDDRLYYHMKQLRRPPQPGDDYKDKPRLIIQGIARDPFLYEHLKGYNKGIADFISPRRFSELLYERIEPDLGLPPPAYVDDIEVIKQALRSISDLQAQLHRALSPHKIGRDPIYDYMAHIPGPVLGYQLVRLDKVFKKWRDRLHEVIHPGQPIQPGSEPRPLPAYTPNKHNHDWPRHWPRYWPDTYELVDKRTGLDGRPKVEEQNTTLAKYGIPIPGKHNILRIQTRNIRDYDHMPQIRFDQYNQAIAARHAASIKRPNRRGKFIGPKVPKVMPRSLRESIEKDYFVHEQLNLQQYGLYGFIDSYIFSILLYLGHQPPVLEPPPTETDIPQIRRTLVSILELHEYLYHGLTYALSRQRCFYLAAIPRFVIYYQMNQLDRLFHRWRNHLLEIFQENGYYLDVPFTYAEDLQDYVPRDQPDYQGPDTSGPIRTSDSVSPQHMQEVRRVLANEMQARLDWTRDVDCEWDVDDREIDEHGNIIIDDGNQQPVIDDGNQQSDNEDDGNQQSDDEDGGPVWYQ